MHIRHSNPATTTMAHRGHQFTALRDGIFEVPDEIGAELIQHGVWTRYTGESAYEIRTPSGATVTDIVDQVSDEAERQERAPEETNWFEEGRKAAQAGLPATAPPGIHQASREAREFRRGHASVESQ